MPNPFDQFDEQPTAAPGANPFDQFDQPAPAEKKQSLMQKIDSAAMKIPGVPALAEFAAATNKAVFDTVDFVGPGAVNAVLNVAGSDKRVPTLAGTLGSEGGYMEPGLGRDVVQAAGKTAPIALGAGQVFRMGAEKLPAIASGGESVARGALRQMGASTAAQDIGYGAAAGAGSVLGGQAGEIVAGNPGRAVGETLGGLAAPVAVATAKPAVEGLIKATARGGEQTRARLQQAISDFAEIGRTPTLGQGTQGIRQGLENLSSKVLGGGPISRALNETGEAMQKRLAQIADDLSGVRGQVEAGRVIQRGIAGDDGFVQRFKTTSGALWHTLDEKIGDAARSKALNTQRALDSLVRGDEFAKALNNPKLEQLQNIFTGYLGKTRINQVTQTRETVDSIAYGDLKALRTQIGEMLGSRELMSDVPRTQLKRLYAALSEDVKEVARQSGALKEFTRANNYTRAGHERIDDFVERITNKVDLDKVYRAVAAGGEGTQALNAMKRSLKPDEWEAVASSVVRSLGKATPGQQDNTEEVFSVAKFLTDWNRLGPGKKVLFSGSDKLNRYSENLDRIAAAAATIKQGAQVMANPSGTGQSMANMGAAVGAMTGLATGNAPMFFSVLVSISANAGAARLMTNPRFVAWLANGTTMKDWPRYIGVLPQIAKSEGLEEEIGSLIQSMQELRDSKPATEDTAGNADAIRSHTRSTNRGDF